MTLRGFAHWAAIPSNVDGSSVVNFGDLVTFDPESVIDRATFANPALVSDGIDLVIVDGPITYRDHQVTGNRTGRFLRRESRA